MSALSKPLLLQRMVLEGPFLDCVIECLIRDTRIVPHGCCAPAAVTTEHRLEGLDSTQVLSRGGGLAAPIRARAHLLFGEASLLGSQTVAFLLLCSSGLSLVSTHAERERERACERTGE